MRIPKALLSLLLFSACSKTAFIQGYKFALVPKHLSSIFFDASRDGCMDRAKFLSKEQAVEVECIYTAPAKFEPDGIKQAELVQGLIDQGDIDGLSISVLNAEPMRPVIQNAIDKGIPVVTFDSDDPDSSRISYIGTDNFFFGEQLGKVLQQIKPTGGNYVIVSDKTPNIMARERGVRSSLQQESKTDWNELSVSPLNGQGNYSYTIDIMRDALQNNNITAVIPVFGGPMFLGEKWIDLVDEFPEVIFVVADGLQVQLDFLARGKVAGLVAQLPYNMGSMSMDSLFSLKSLALAGQQADIPDFQGTNVLEHVMVPLVLPELTVNRNLLGDLKYVGFALFGIIALTSLFFLGWTCVNRSVRVIQAAQPGFLALVAFGVLIMGFSIVPLSFDDSSPDYTQEMGDLRCMTVPWLLFIGFTLIFAALFAKLWRINRLFQSSSRFQRVTLKIKDVMIPMVALLTANAAALTWWTFTDPLKYRRADLPGTDAWNRVIGTWGGCMSEDALPYALVLIFLNVGVMILASWQAYRARNIESEFAESKYVGMALISMLQVSLIGMPLLVLVRDDPKAWYWTMSLMVFIICMVVLLFIFIPKMRQFRHHVHRSDQSQQFILSESVRQTQDNLNHTRTMSREPTITPSVGNTSGEDDHGGYTSNDDDHGGYAPNDDENSPKTRPNSTIPSGSIKNYLGNTSTETANEGESVSSVKKKELKFQMMAPNGSDDNV